mgnify:CR=1 FL=1
MSSVSRGILSNYRISRILGKGTFSTVKLATDIRTNEKIAIKILEKNKINNSRDYNRINREINIVKKISHINIVQVFEIKEDLDKYYILMEYCEKGELFDLILSKKKLSEDEAAYYFYQLVNGLEYIHMNNIIHRDIKPENLVLDEKGYVRITDFGIAKENLPDNSSETSGTPGYMAPEVMKAKNHSFPVDFFAIGVIGYEFMLGKRPYYGKNRKEIKDQMLSTPAVIKEENIAHGWSSDSADFINLLLKRKEEKRLGYKNGAIELMNHPWLKYYPWNDLKNKTLLAPFIPEEIDNFDKHYCEGVDKISEETQIRYEEIYLSSYFKNAFVDFFFDGDDEKEKKKKLMEEKERKEKEEQEEKEKAVKEKKEKEQTEQILKEIEFNEKLLQIEKRQLELNKSVSDRNINYNNNQELRSVNHNDNTLLLKRSNKFLLQDNNSIYIKKNNRTTLNTNKNKNNTNNKNTKEKSNESSINLSRKLFENKNKKIKNLKNPLSHSNSTRDIYLGNTNIKKYLTNKINQLQKNKNQNNNNNQAKPIIKHPSSKSKINNSLMGNYSTKGGTSANIHINNYYTNNIYNSIYNNYMPRKIFNKNGKTNKNIKYKRPSSVLAPKRSSSKFKTYKKNEKLDKSFNLNNNGKDKDNNKINCLSKRSMSRTNCGNKVKIRPNSEFILSKNKFKSMNNQN